MYQHQAIVLHMNETEMRPASIHSKYILESIKLHMCVRTGEYAK